MSEIDLNTVNVKNSHDNLQEKQLFEIMRIKPK